MAKDFRELEAKMGPERTAHAKGRAKEILAEMLSAEFPQLGGITPDEVAAARTKSEAPQKMPRGGERCG